MQKRGYNTAYINIPQAAGLATETLAAHVGQRIRWARGMIQIFRTDNPLFGGKLKFTQRLCYFNAMAHFLYAVPRLVFLGAPLVYLLLGRTIIPGYWVAILAYALPHLVLGQPYQLPYPGQASPLLLERNLRSRPGALHPGPDFARLYQPQARQVQCHRQRKHPEQDPFRPAHCNPNAMDTLP